MRAKISTSLTLAAVLALVATAPAAAQQHRATSLGNPATRFAKPLKKGDDLRVLLRAEKAKADVAAVLQDAGWAGDVADLERAAATAEVVPMSIAPGTTLPFMAARKNGKAYAMKDVLWAGAKPIDALGFEFSSRCVRYRLVTPKACSNFWVETLGKDTTDPACAPKKVELPPVVSVSGASEVCVTQPAEYAITVKNPPADNDVKLYVNGKELVSDKLTNGSFRFTFTGAPTPGTYEVKAVSGGVASTASVQVKACQPTCGITASPLPAKAGKPFTVDLSGSRVAAGVRGGVKTAKVEVLDASGAVIDTVDMAGLSNSAFVIRKGGIHTLRAVVTDESGQTSTNACTAQVDVKGGLPIFVGGYFGKERLTHDDASDHDDVAAFADFSRCAPLAGFQVGIQPRINDKTEFEGALGVKFPFEDDAHTTMFADAAVNRLASRGFFGGGLSWWDIGKDSTGVGLLLQAGVDLDKDGKWQLVGQTRLPFFNQLDNIDNNYQFWGGIRFKPNSWK
jgi:hypothetical protein